MERKIGEIFKFGGEWYQTVEAPIDEHSCNGCQGCCMGGSHIFEGECNGNARKDGKFVIFKKFEKIGKPFSCNYYGDDRLITMQEYQLFDLNVIYCYQMPPIYVVDHKHKRIAIEVNKEDMGENDDIRPYDELFSPGTVSNTKHLAKEDMEEKKLNLKPFDIQKAREGKPVCTRNGKRARIICFDAKGVLPIIALVESGDEEKTVRYSNSGRFRFDGTPDEEDLIMLSEKKEGWVNIVKESLSDDRVVLGRIFDSYEDAFMSGEANERYIATVKIEWTE